MAEDEYKRIFAQNLNYYLNLYRKNQMDLIKDLNLSSSTVSNWCTGLKLPRMDKIQLLADYFGILKSDLLEEKKGEAVQSPDVICLAPKEEQLVMAFRSLNKQGQEYILQTMDLVKDKYKKSISVSDMEDLA